MVLSAGRCASVVALAAVVDTLVAPLLALEERNGLGVLCHVGGDAVAADAREGQGGGVTCVALGSGGLGGWLQADQLGFVLGGCRLRDECLDSTLTGHCVIWLSHQYDLREEETLLGSMVYCCCAEASESRALDAIAVAVEVFIV